MKRTVYSCDACKKDYQEGYDYSMMVSNTATNIGKGIQVRTTYHQHGMSGVSAWADVDLCPECKRKVLVCAAKQWASCKGKFEFSQQAME